MSLYRGDDYFAGKLFITGNLFCHPESQTRLSGGAFINYVDKILMIYDPPSPLRWEVYYISLCSIVDIWQHPSPPCSLWMSPSGGAGRGTLAESECRMKLRSLTVGGSKWYELRGAKALLWSSSVFVAGLFCTPRLLTITFAWSEKWQSYLGINGLRLATDYPLEIRW